MDEEQSGGERTKESVHDTPGKEDSSKTVEEPHNKDGDIEEEGGTNRYQKVSLVDPNG